jgi:hypothetical protein
MLILMLVLGITSVANAAFTLVVDGEEVGGAIDLIGGGLIDIGIYNDTQGDTSNTQQLYALVIINDITGGEWTGLNNVYIPPAVPGSFNTPSPHPLVGVFEGHFTNLNPYFSGVGVLGDYQYHCLKADNSIVTVELMDGTSGMILDSLAIHQIPEPMTIALLGLGGLFLLHRRK